MWIVHTFPLTLSSRLAAALCVCSIAHAGILVVRSDKGLEFIDAYALAVNGKDKASGLGSQPKIAGPIGKLPSTHLNGALVKDGPAGVVALYAPGEVVYILPEGLPKNPPNDPAAIWRTARITYRKSASDKTLIDVSAV